MTTRNEGGIKDDQVNKATYITSTLGSNGISILVHRENAPKLIRTSGKCSVIRYQTPDYQDASKEMGSFLFNVISCCTYKN